jgi:hypothetical protein
VAVLLLGAVLGWVSGVAAADVVARWAVELVGGLAAQGPRMLLMLFLAAGGAVWAALALAVARSGAVGGRPAWARPEAAARWGRVAAIVAALCPLPYVLVRLTWLTPWPVGLPTGAAADLVAAVLLQGLLLGGAALGGAVLTTGLVARWGEVWPRWVPGVHGRPVPVAAAVVPATAVSALLCAAAGPLVAMSARDGDPSTLLLLPLPVWGPALGAAALGYALRRAGARHDLPPAGERDPALRGREERPVGGG